MELTAYHTRFKDCPWYSEEYQTVSIGGAGGIGSWLAFFLGRIGVPMDIYDFDSIDYTNMGGQLFPTNAIGLNKVEAVIDNVRKFSGDLPIRNMGRFNDGHAVSNITFACFDNMKARASMFASWNARNSEGRIGTPRIFIDGRMTVESFQIIAVTPDKANDYLNEHIFHDGLIEEPICSMKATSHIGAMIGSQMTQVFTNYMTNFNLGMELREVPFFQAYETAFMTNI